MMNYEKKSSIHLRTAFRLCLQSVKQKFHKEFALPSFYL